MKITTMNIDGRIVSTVNVSGIVGYAGANQREDVMLIQGLFKYISEGLYPGAVGLGGAYRVPEISGEIDADTYLAIGEFQIRNAGKLLMRTFDGRIHPASYQNRRIQSGPSKRFMSITLLHLIATDAAVIQGHRNYVQGLTALSPELAKIIDMAIISA